MPKHRNSHVDAYDEAYWDEVFWVWLGEADRNQSRTAAILAEREAELAAEEGRPPRQTPTSSAISRKATRKDADGFSLWVKRAQKELATHAPAHYHAFMGRTLMLLDKSTARIARLLDDDDPRVKELEAKDFFELSRKAHRDLLETAGIGMFGQKLARPEIPVPHEAALTSGDPESIAANFHARVLKAGGEE